MTNRERWGNEEFSGLRVAAREEGNLSARLTVQLGKLTA